MHTTVAFFIAAKMGSALTADRESYTCSHARPFRAYAFHLAVHSTAYPAFSTSVCMSVCLIHFQESTEMSSMTSRLGCGRTYPKGESKPIGTAYASHRRGSPQQSNYRPIISCLMVNRSSIVEALRELSHMTNAESCSHLVPTRPER
jgi:hypothetical protein